jgi:hypothetical protein
MAASRGTADGAATMADRGGTAPSGNAAVVVTVPQRPHAIPTPRKRSAEKPWIRICPQVQAKVSLPSPVRTGPSPA